MIPHSKPDLAPEDCAEVLEQLRSGSISEGPRTAMLQAEFEAAFDADTAVATGSGSQALLLALLAANVEAGDEVIMPAYICAEVLSVTKYLGARPVIVDSGDDYLMDPAEARAVLTPRTKAIIYPYTLGIYGDARPLLELGPVLIEDCAQYTDPLPRRLPEICGGLAIYSFEATKMMASGEGGMVTTNDPHLARELLALKRYNSSDFKLNLFPLSDLQAALAGSQLQRLPAMLARRAEIAKTYFGAFEGMPGVDLPHHLAGRSLFFRFPIRLNAKSARDADNAMTLAAKHGVTVRRPVTPLLDAFVDPKRPIPVAMRLHAETLSLPLYPALQPDEIDVVIESVRTALQIHH